MANSSQPKNWRDALPIHPAANILPPINDDELAVLSEDIKIHSQQQPVALFHDSDGNISLLDGRSRLNAMEKIGAAIIKDGELDPDAVAIIAVPGNVDPYAYVMSANVHRRHLNNDDKRGVIADLLKARPDQSNRQVAAQVGVDHKTVGTVRTQCEATGEIPQLKKTVGADGKSRSKPQKASKPVSPRKTEPIGSPPVRYSEVPATSVPRLSATAHFLVNDVSRLLKEAVPKLGGERTEVFIRIRALVNTDDIVGEALRLVEKMTVSQRRDFIARLQKGGLVVACGLQGSAEIPIEQPQAEHAALDEIPADLSIPARLRRLQ